MGLYMNGIEYTLATSKGFFNIDIMPSIQVLNNLKSTSSDNYILKDKNGIYLTLKKEDE